jgi:hypothetical protein
MSSRYQILKQFDFEMLYQAATAGCLDLVFFQFFLSLHLLHTIRIDKVGFKPVERMNDDEKVIRLLERNLPGPKKRKIMTKGDGWIRLLPKVRVICG